MRSCLQCPLNTDATYDCGAPTLADRSFTITQNNGGLSFDFGATIMDGTVDADGAFRVGGVMPVTTDDGVDTGQTLLLIEGDFVGNRVVATMTFRATMNDESNGREVMDMQGNVSFTLERAE